MNILKDLYKRLSLTNGFTYSPQRKTPTYGYMVSIQGFESVLPFDVSREEIQYHIQEYIKYHIILAINRGAYFGGWVDGQTMYLDMSVWVETLAHAHGLAKENSQLAFYDIIRQKSVKVENTPKRGS